MPRLPLIHIPNGLYSVVSKCNNDEFLFNAPEKFEMYIRHLIECKKTLGFIIYDIVCMSNHVHELYQVPEKITISQILHKVKGGFSKKFNKKYGRTGHFWRNKPFYRIVENEEYAVITMNYFHYNPVRAGLVTSPENWPYSGYRFHVLGERVNLLGLLLDSITNGHASTPNMNTIKSVEKTLNHKRGKFIGSRKFRKEMKITYGRSNNRWNQLAHME